MFGGVDMNIQNILQRKGLEMDLILAALALCVSFIMWFDPRPHDPFGYWTGNLLTTFSLVLGAVLYGRLLKKGGLGFIIAVAAYYVATNLLPDLLSRYSLILWILIAMVGLYVLQRMNIPDQVADESNVEELTLLNLRN
jgi:hypothetical protein